ncbi:uncharacterized protein DDB_G0284311 [Microplitis mediator]|uniref:uncharacterized protein DDB_G0284311 n=1 Tax=Microplitis mediator TaxID=375433 RepID=UPI00255566E8|nr:uncharacterized protein DDB_G0284311 [Microplitis mediator]
MGTLLEANGPASNNPGSKDQNIYENRASTKKIIRVVTVIAYLFSVSFVAIVLSAYYVFLWQPPNPRLIHRAHTMDKIHAEYLSDTLPHEYPINDNINNNYKNNKSNKKSVGEIFNSMNNLRSHLFRFHAADKNDNNRNIKNNNDDKYVKAINTTQLRNPMIGKIYHDSDKVTTSDLQTSVYGIVNKHLDLSVDDKKTTDKSALFTKIENSTEINVSLTPELLTEINKYEEEGNTNFENKTRDDQEDPDNHDLVSEATEVTTDKFNYQATEHSNVQELQDDKTTLNGTEFLNKLKSMYTTSSDQENIKDSMKIETTVELLSTTDSFISIVQEETSKSYDADIDQIVLPER